MIQKILRNIITHYWWWYVEINILVSVGCLKLHCTTACGLEVGAVDGALITVTYGVASHANTAYQCGGGVSDCWW